MKPKIFFILGMSLLLAACGSAAAQTLTPTPIPTVQAEGAVIAQGRLEPVRYVDIGFNVSGLVSQVLVAEGDSVSSDQVIARLDDKYGENLPSAQAKALQDLTDAYDAVRVAQRNLDNFDIPSDIRSLTPAAGVEQTYQELEQARANYEPYRYLSNHNSRLLKKALDDAWDEYHLALNWMGLEAKLETAKADLAQRQNDYASLQTNAGGAAPDGSRGALANAELRAPFAGTITHLDLKASEFASPGQTPVTLADCSTWVIKTTDLTEMDVVHIQVGAPVTITLEAIPGVNLRGVVQSISDTYLEKQGDIDYVVTVTLTDQDPRLRWGMTAQVRFNE